MCCYQYNCTLLYSLRGNPLLSPFSPHSATHTDRTLSVADVRLVALFAVLSQHIRPCIAPVDRLTAARLLECQEEKETASSKPNC